MKNRLIITVSDVHSTRAFNVHQIAKKLIVFIVVFVILVIGGGSWFINSLSTEFDLFKKDKESEINVLTEKEKKLQAQNQFYSMQIKGKVQDIEALSSKLDYIEDMIGLKHEEDKKEEITKEALNALDENTKLFMLATMPAGKPLKNIRTTSKFGYRIHPITKKKKFHRGLDLKAKMRTDVYSTADGVVTYVQPKNRGGFGRVIKIQHNYGFETTYAHLNKTNVKIGDVVKKNQKIAKSGNSGKSNGPHLHYELKYASRVLNPKDFIRWDMGNFDEILKRQRRVKWDSLVKLIKEQHKLVQQ